MKKDLDSLLAGYQSGFTLDQAFYSSDDVFSAEWNFIFKKRWLFAGNTAQIQQPGDFFLYHLQHDSVIVIRGNNGEVYAHHNTCRHRGSAICLQDSGTAAKLICPYHQWVYDKDGKLLSARMMPTEFCKEDHHLSSVQVRVIEGLIFICLAEESLDFSAIQQSLTAYLQPFKIDSAKVAGLKKFRINANWKLVAENFRECYHCGGAHPEYCSAVIGANLREDADELTQAKQQTWNEKGLETKRVEIVEGTTTYAVRYPLRPGVESYSVDGKRVAIPMGSHRDYDAGVVGLVNYPNFWLDAVSDYVWTMRITPINASTTDVEFCWLVDGKASEGDDYDPTRLMEFWEITSAQDRKLCEDNFKGIQSGAYLSGRYAPVEDQVVNFVDWCVTELKNGSKR